MYIIHRSFERRVASPLPTREADLSFPIPSLHPFVRVADNTTGTKSARSTGRALAGQVDSAAKETRGALNQSDLDLATLLR